MFASLLSLLQVTTVDCMESLSLVPLYREAPARFPLAVLESLIVLLGQLHIDQTALAKHIGGCTISIIVALRELRVATFSTWSFFGSSGEDVSAH